MTSISDFTFAGSTKQQFPLYVTRQNVAAANVAGVIGEDILSHFDIEFDLALNKIRLFIPKDCNGDQVAYWAKDYFLADLTHTESYLPLVTVMLNGHKVSATFASGIPQSTITTRALRQSGIQTSDPSVAVAPSFVIGQETVHNAKLRIAGSFSRYNMQRMESELGHLAFVEPDMDIGGDFFLTHRIYIARGQDKVYFTYNGGPIFQAAALTTSPAPSAMSDGEVNRHSP